MRTLIKNGWIPGQNGCFEGDILLEDGRILWIGTGISAGIGDQVIDASGRYVLPGGVDVHTHMDLLAGSTRAVDDFYDGTVGAACGGTTTIVDHMGFGPAGCALHHQLGVYHELADGKAVIDYGFHGTAQHVDEAILNELEELAADGVPSVKVYLTYDYRIGDDGILQILKKMKEIGGVTAFHCENHQVIELLRQECRQKGLMSPIYHAKSRPNLAEAEAVSRVLYLARLAGDAPVYIVHLSCRESLEAVREARRRGQRNIYAETCPQYLLLTEERYQEPDGLKYIMSPPLRTREDCEALWKGIADGEIQVVATDHCPFRYEKEKQLGKEDFTRCPNGAPGVEERMSLMFSEGVMKGRISLERFVQVCCTNPAIIYGLYPKKGVLEPGADGDLILLDPRAERYMTKDQLHGAADYTAYEGWKLQGKIDLVMQRGRIIVQDHSFVGNRGDGQFLKRTVQRLGSGAENRAVR